MTLMKHGARGWRSLLTIGAALAYCACCACTHTVEAAYRSQRRSAVSTVMTRQIENAVDAGSGDHEMHALRQRLAADAHDMNARITLARLYAKRGYPDLALEHYRMAMLQDPDSLVAVLELAKALRQMDQKETALEALQFYSLRHPWDSEKQGQPPPAWEVPSLEGVLEDELGRLEPAEQAHRAALKIEPNRAGLHNNLGYNLLLQNKPKEAATEFQSALRLDPRSELAHNNLGAALALLAPPGEPAKPPKKGKPDPQKALSDWERSQDPAVAHNNLAALLIEQGRWPEARQELQAALDANPGFAPALANLQLVSAGDGNPAAVNLAARPKHVNFWKRAASTILGGDAPAPKPVVSPQPVAAPVAASGSGDGVQ
ncbi:MAG TPA: tetratricopeptide repeat protein [Bryobacteraceae bacterium]|nr:tetratricopeptide repeat protein [Bryobacteraceae bacterium]